MNHGYEGSNPCQDGMSNKSPDVNASRAVNSAAYRSRNNCSIVDHTLLREQKSHSSLHVVSTRCATQLRRVNVKSKVALLATLVRQTQPHIDSGGTPSAALHEKLRWEVVIETVCVCNEFRGWDLCVVLTT